MPADLVPIPTACSHLHTRHTVVGIVVDKLDPYHSRGSSACVTFTLKDSDFDLPSHSGGLKVKYFNDDTNELPAVDVNDVVLLRGIKVNGWNGKPVGVASQYEKIYWAIFRPHKDPTANLTIITGPGQFEPTSLEKRIARSLLEHVTSQDNFVVPPPPKKTPKAIQGSNVVQASMPARNTGGLLPISLIKDVQPGKLCQLIGQVVRAYTAEFDKCTLYITDYTENEQLENILKEDDENIAEGDSYGYLSRKSRGWPGPWGKMSLQVTLWEPHATFARAHIKPGNIVHITYARIKDGFMGLEGVIHQDRNFSSKVHIAVVLSEYNQHARDLMNRRKEYWKENGSSKEDVVIEKKKIAQKARKMPEKDEQREDAQIHTTTSLPGKVLRTTLNPSIKIREYGATVRSIESILSAETHSINIPSGITYKLPFQNVCYQANVRVVDFFPPKLEDFAVQIADNPIAHRGYDSQPMVWEWCFCLLVEGIDPMVSRETPRDQMRLYVSGAEAQHLLHLDAANLRRNQQRLGELREQLFHLWGNLEECKMSASARVGKKVSSLPFQCCIKEYGVQCDHAKDPDGMDVDGEPCGKQGCFGWDRRFAIFGTQIRE
ncbi:hypothetical protein N7495_005754 [Penicillium taxi]|uniref:uncharacterized protein n=1 Tax=Penicillium taxi TaxID=168475 RepID=UPI0025450063|nr:uncharacterized protein N7495_005754 [Penicillium taxi]KAJ5894063.1 hypothetical protein N7495_005754 [Penicillium taxi]